MCFYLCCMVLSLIRYENAGYSLCLFLAKMSSDDDRKSDFLQFISALLDAMITFVTHSFVLPFKAVPIGKHREYHTLF